MIQAQRGFCFNGDKNIRLKAALISGGNKKLFLQRQKEQSHRTTKLNLVPLKL
jgi:hypothetical protein